MIKKGLIVALFTLGGVVVAGGVAAPVCYFLNAQSQNVKSEQSDSKVLVKDEEVYLSTNENPLYPGESRTVDIEIKETIPTNTEVSLYYDDFVGKGHEYLSLNIFDSTKETKYASMTSIKDNSADNKLTFKFTPKSEDALKFVYTLSSELPNEYQELEFSFTMHLVVEKNR